MFRSKMKTNIDELREEFKRKHGEDGLESLDRNFFNPFKKVILKDVYAIIKAWDGYGDDRFPEGTVKELRKEIKQLLKVKK